MSPRTVVAGGGAAGLMAAGRAAEQGHRVLLLEKMARTGRKIGISGKGRCNITNSAELTDFLTHFGKNGRFLRQCFQQFFNTELLAFFSSRGLPVVLERGGRYFPESGRALDVVRLFTSWLTELQVEVQYDRPLTDILTRDGAIHGVISKGRKYSCQNLVVATGGKSYPRTGSSGDGYALLKKLGHTVTPLRPALVPIKTNNPNLGALSGLALRNVEVRVFIDNKRKAREFGEISFTGSGFSGPAILTLSPVVVEALAENSRVSLAIDLKPALDENKLDARLMRDLQERGGEPIASILRGLLPRQLIPLCLAQCQVPEGIDTLHFPGKMRKRMVRWFKDFRFEVTGYGSWNEAIITSGGVSLKEVNPRTMESRLVKGLFIAGELLDIQADTGGYNLQAAFSSGWLAGSSCYR